ncbi:MAG: SDR family oxidoreductase [Parvibaculaceae bacterium]
MDLRIHGRKAIVCASTRGLGRACALSLAREGVDVVINGRTDTHFDDALASIRAVATGKITAIAADISTSEGRAKLIAACPDADILVNNNDGPPPGNFQTWEEADWHRALEANLLAPVFMIKGLIEGMKERRFGRIVNITSAMVKAPRAVMGLSTTARSGLTAMCKGLSVEVAPFNVTINNMLPERFDTERQQQMAKLTMQFKKITYEEARSEIAQSIAAKRMGEPSEFGDACAYLCSAQAGFISGQNLQLDGGTYPGLI